MHMRFVGTAFWVLSLTVGLVLYNGAAWSLDQQTQPKTEKPAQEPGAALPNSDVKTDAAGRLGLAPPESPALSSQAKQGQRPEPMPFMLEVQFSGVGMAGIDDGPAEVGYSQTNFTAKAYGFSLGYEFRNYRWGDTDKLPFYDEWVDPFNEMHTVWAGYEHTGRINPKWGYRINARLSSSFEDDITAQPTGILGGTVDYALNRDLVIMAGVFGSYNRADQFVLPIVGVIYRPWAKSGFSGALSFPFTRLSYHFTPKLSATIRAGFIRRTYKLSEDNPVRPDGEFRTREFSGGLSLNYAFNSHWELSVGGDYLFARELTLFDDGGNGGTDYDLDNTWGGFAKLTFRF
jgi:hypothetical protein